MRGAWLENHEPPRVFSDLKARKNSSWVRSGNRVEDRADLTRSADEVAAAGLHPAYHAGQAGGRQLTRAAASRARRL